MTERHKLPTERRSVTHRFNVGTEKGYVIVGLYPDGTPGEVFIRMAKPGTTVSGLLDSLSIVTSLALQHGVPLATLCAKLARVRFEPDGYSGPEFKFASSVVDYVFRWLEARYVSTPRPQDSAVSVWEVIHETKA